MDEIVILEERANKIKKKFNSWIEDNQNKFFFGILIVSLILRIYYFFLTLNQPLWWDEAEYMSMAKAWAFDNFEYGFLAVRPILFSLIATIFLKITSTIGAAELFLRLFMFVLSFLSVVGTYYLGKEICNKKVGLISSLFMSVFYLNLFFSYRLLVDLPSLTFFIFTALFFYKYLNTNSPKMLYLGSVIIAIGTLFKLSTASFLFAFLIFLLFTQKLSFLKKKEIWIAGAIFFLILAPYIIWGYFQFHGFVIIQAGAFNAPESSYLSNGFTNVKSYLSSFPTYLSWPLLIFFLFGILALLFKLLIGFDFLVKNKSPDTKKNFYLILIFLVPLITISLSLGYIEDRYLLPSFPAIFIIASIFIMKTYDWVKKNNKTIAILLLILLLGYVAYFQLNANDLLMKSKINSYGDIKSAGLWIEENLDENSVVFTRSVPQIAYYTNIKVRDIPKEKEVFLEQLSNLDNTTNPFLMISIFERHIEEWIYPYPQEANLTPIKVYFLDPEQTQPSLVIYRV